MNARFFLVAGGLALVGYAMYSRYKGGSSGGDALATSGGSGSTSFAPTEGRANAPTLGGDSIIPVTPITPGESSPSPVESDRRTIMPVRMIDERMPKSDFSHPLSYR